MDIRWGAAILCAAAVVVAGCSSQEASSSQPSAQPSSANTTPKPPQVQLADLTVQDTRQMSNAKARAWLRKWARQTHGSEMLDMKGSWVAQVSSKCTGLDVDIDGGMPDGTVDTYGVDDAQILGFHLALKESMSAVTMKWSELSDNPTTGPCAGKTLWVALVPRTYPSAKAALKFCRTNGFPYGECAARYVPADSSETTLMYLPGQAPDTGGSRDDEPADTEPADPPADSDTDAGDSTEDEAPRERPQPVYLTAPSVIGMEHRDAEDILKAMGFNPHTGPSMQDGAVSTDLLYDCYIVDQFHNPGAQVKVGSMGGRPIPPAFPMDCAP